jgi:hypothetical protein
MMKLRLGVALLFAVVSQVGCTGNPKQEVLIARPSGPALPGRFFATAGPADTQADLYNVQFIPGPLMYALTSDHRTFGVDGCPTSLTIDVAGADVNFQDTLRSFNGTTTSAIEGLGDGFGSLAAVGPDCRMIFVRLDRSTNPPTDHLMLFDPTRRSVRELYSPGGGKVLGVSDWGPDGRIAAFEGTAPSDGHPTVPTSIVLISPDGSKRSLPPPVTALGTLQWGASKWIAISDEVGGKTIFMDPDSPSRAELPGWIPLSWSPDGQRLMVTDPRERKALAVVESSNLGTARLVGHAKTVSFNSLLWLPPDATAGGPLPVGRRPDDGDG